VSVSVCVFGKGREIENRAGEGCVCE